MCAKNRNRWSSGKPIVKIRRRSFLPHIVDGNLPGCLRELALFLGFTTLLSVQVSMPTVVLSVCCRWFVTDRKIVTSSSCHIWSLPWTTLIVHSGSVVHSSRGWRRPTRPTRVRTTPITTTTTRTKGFTLIDLCPPDQRPTSRRRPRRRVLPRLPCRWLYWLSSSWCLYRPWSARSTSSSTSRASSRCRRGPAATPTPAAVRATTRDLVSQPDIRSSGGSDLAWSRFLSREVTRLTWTGNAANAGIFMSFLRLCSTLPYEAAVTPVYTNVYQ